MIKFCSLYSGSSGNSLFIGVGKTKILIDAGLSGIKITKALSLIDESPEELCAILITHDHVDHVKGAGILSRRYNIPIYANGGTWEVMKNLIGPVALENIKVFNTGTILDIGSLTVKSFPIPHDAAEPVGFNFFAENKKITVATDIGHINPELIENLEGSELILLESNHDVEMLRTGPYPWPLKKRISGGMGHLSNDKAGKVVCNLAKKGSSKFFLGHLSRENNFPELAYQTVYNVLCENKIEVGKDVTLEVATRDCISRVVEL
ncbi:MAG TPA: MBL fold metallo-hydrolase [Clostridiaceae bacterium]|nr:MBL fold metallo-hydrolase [Clostridiaceae bacterium]